MACSPTTFPGVFSLVQKPAQPHPAFPLGLGAQGVHELCETAFGDMGALTGFALAAAKPAPGPVFWVRQLSLRREHGRLLEAGLSALTRNRKPILHAEPRKLSDTLWTLEEAVRSSAVSLVVAEIEDIDFTASRRLSLAAGRHGVPVILLLPWRHEGATAAIARWRVKPRPSAPNSYDARAPGALRWQATLERSRQAPSMAGKVFNLELDDGTLSLRVVSGLAADTPAPRKAPDPGQADRTHILRSA